MTAGILVLNGCGQHSTEKHSDSDGNEQHDGDKHEADAKGEHADEIIFQKEKADAIGLTTKEIAPETFNQVIKTTGQILAAQGDETTVAATVAGIVSFGKPIIEGASVVQGSPLLTISSKGLSEGDAAVKARISYETAKKEYERAQNLIKDKIISEKEYNTIRQNYETARIAFDALSGQYTSKGQNITAPMTGFVKNRLVSEGDYVAVGQPLITLSQNRRLVLRAEVSERYYKYLPQIGSANFKTPYDDQVYQLSDLNGRLISFGKSSSGNSVYIPVTFEFDNKGNIIAGSYVEVFLLGEPMQNVLTVPVSALIEEQGLYFVYIQLDEEGYKKQEVTLGANNGKEVQILSGIKPGDRVVTSGAYQVKLAANSGVIPEGHNHNH